MSMGLFKYGAKPPRPDNLPQERRSTHAHNEIEHYGLVSPRYPQDLSARRVIDFAYLPGDKVLLLASMDGSYPYWASVTDIDDVETNTAIADTILFEGFSSFTSTHPKLSNLMSNRYRRRFSVNGGNITTPFEYGFSSEPDQVKYWGRHLAIGISRHYREIRELCTLRELDGSYLTFLRSYLKMLETRTSSDDVRNYENKRMLVKLLTSEDYLFVSDDEAIRSAYVEARQKIGSLYNTYMSIVR